MSIRENGIKALHHSADGTVDSWTKICDEVKISTTNLDPSEILNELSNSKSQSGSEWEPEFHIPDFTNYDTIEAFAVGASRAKKFIAIEFFDGTIYATNKAVYLRVMPNMSANRRDGDAHWILKFDLADDMPVNKIAALTS